MKLKLEYGETGLAVDIPDTNLVKVLRMKDAAPIADPTAELKRLLAAPLGTRPLAELAQGRRDACVVICDITRPVPNSVLLPPILQSLEAAGIPRERITILIATGMHRPNEGEELVQLVGPDIARDYRIVNHFSRRDEDHVHLGETSRGAPVHIDRRYVEADLKITTGFIEPHLMAGFSGGRKLVCPGLASARTMEHMHGAKLLSHPNCREGVIEGNPFHEEILQIAGRAGMDFMVNVSLDEGRRITGMFAGDLTEAHAAGVAFVRRQVRDTVPEPVDVVLTTSAGYPLDTSFYQAVKGVTAALPIVKEGGSIVLAAECREGIGGEEFSQLVREFTDLNDFMDRILNRGHYVIDQWQLQEYAKAWQKVTIFMHASGIPESDRAHAPARMVGTVEEGVRAALDQAGPGATLAVIPKGPYVLAEVGE